MKGKGYKKKPGKKRRKSTMIACGKGTAQEKILRPFRLKRNVWDAGGGNVKREKKKKENIPSGKKSFE